MDIDFDITACVGLTKHELQTELKKFRNDLIKEKMKPSSLSNTNSNTTTQPLVTKQTHPVPPNQPTETPTTTFTSSTPQNTAQDAWNKRVGNRNGININTLTPNNNKVSFREDAAPNIDKQNKFNVVEQVDNTFYIRANLPIKDYVTHIPTIIKSFFLTLQQADPSLLLLPFDHNNTSSQDTIEKESAIPNEENRIKKWVSGIRIKNNRIGLAIRVQNNMPVAELKSVLSAWEKKTNSFVDMDNIRSSRKLSAGCLQFAHPRYVNRDELKKWMVSQAPDVDVSGWFKIFARGIFENDADKSKKNTYTCNSCRWISG